MNDFTKEELIDIHYAVRHFWKHPSSHVLPSETEDINNSHELMGKLQSMIDNYCEHLNRIAGADENGHMLVQCERCTSILWHEKD